MLLMVAARAGHGRRGVVVVVVMGAGAGGLEVAGVVGASREGEKREGKRESEGERQQTAEASRPRAQAEADEKSERGLSLRQRQSPITAGPSRACCSRHDSESICCCYSSCITKALVVPWYLPGAAPVASTLALAVLLLGAGPTDDATPPLLSPTADSASPRHPCVLCNVHALVVYALSTPECSCHGSLCMAGVHLHLR
jgi:hypothetical protein